MALDPSGSFTEGKGTTGWCFFDIRNDKVIRAGAISAVDYTMMEGYWDAHIKLINKYANQYKNQILILMEDYILYANKSDAQINSRMETCKLLGLLQHLCWARGINYRMQLASEVKTRWSDEILCHKKYIIKFGNGFALENGTTLNRHCKDAIRHAVHFAKFRNKPKV